jgi:hypothetical protein
MIGGSIIGIFTAEIASAEMTAHESVTLQAGLGILGDRYATGLGHYSGRPHPDRQVTIIEVEVLEAIRNETGIELAPSETRQPRVGRHPSRQAGRTEIQDRGVSVICGPAQHALRVPRAPCRFARDAAAYGPIRNQLSGTRWRSTQSWG